VTIPSLRQIAIFCFDDAEELDVVGPWEVLALWTQNFPDDGYRASLVSSDGRAVRCAKGLVLQPHSPAEELPAIDVLVYPGGLGTRPHLRDDARLEWVRAQQRTGTLMTSVCTGALVYAAAGLLRNRPATTHWAAIDELATIDPSISIRPDDRYVDDGDIVTSAGVSAGIDMALHLVDRLAGTDRARATRRGIQYDPKPPV